MFCPIINDECKSNCILKSGGTCLMCELPETFRKISSTCSEQTKIIEDTKCKIIKSVEEQEKTNHFLKCLVDKE